MNYYFILHLNFASKISTIKCYRLKYNDRYVRYSLFTMSFDSILVLYSFRDTLWTEVEMTCITSCIAQRICKDIHSFSEKLFLINHVPLAFPKCNLA